MKNLLSKLGVAYLVLTAVFVAWGVWKRQIITPTSDPELYEALDDLSYQLGSRTIAAVKRLDGTFELTSDDPLDYIGEVIQGIRDEIRGNIRKDAGI